MGGPAAANGPKCMEVDVTLGTACRYRRVLGGASVCWAGGNVSVVTDTECAQCAVPQSLEDVDCHYLQARVSFGAAPNAIWICGATRKPVNREDPFDRAPCDSCRRRSPRWPSLE
ncbi:MAG: hypothetical protein GF393_04350 [Armatimonadia bacterium]|nr:hypothetical protein [Armatimonadia bacterium]